VQEHLKRNPPSSEESWQQLFAIRTVIDGRLSTTAMVGDYGLSGEGPSFSPRYPLRPSTTYVATCNPATIGHPEASALAVIKEEFRLPDRPPRAPTRLTHIFPSADVLPENLLKFYLHFTEPMSRGEAYRRIRLLDQTGKQVPYPFLELSEELWSPDGKRFTLYFEPGRIKRGLKPREEVGPVLMEGGSYTLVIDRGWPDGDSQELAETVRKSFKVVAPDDTQPNHAQWRISAPAPRTQQLLTVDFDEALDSAMLQRVLSVRSPGGEFLSGKIIVSEREKRWQFEPQRTWEPGTHKLVVATTLEDVAGNSIGRPFEVDVFRPAKQSIQDETVELSFVVAK
jgi:hypothetical protein